MAGADGKGWAGKIASFLWWSYPRASIEYDVMVGLILAFIFLVPRSFFHDGPRPEAPARAAATQVSTIPLPHGAYYQVITRQPPSQLGHILASYAGHPVKILGEKTWRPAVGGPVIYGVWTR